MENPLNAAGCRREPMVDVPGDGALSDGLGGIKILPRPVAQWDKLYREPANNAALSGSVDEWLNR